MNSDFRQALFFVKIVRWNAIAEDRICTEKKRTVRGLNCPLRCVFCIQ